MIATFGALAAPVATAAEAPTLEEIKTCLRQQREKIESLYIEVKWEEKPCVELDVLLTLPGFTRKILLMNDEVHFAMKGEKRYSRMLRSADEKYLRPVGHVPKLHPNASRLEKESHKQMMKSRERMKVLTDVLGLDPPPVTRGNPHAWETTAAWVAEQVSKLAAGTSPILGVGEPGGLP